VEEEIALQNSNQGADFVQGVHSAENHMPDKHISKTKSFSPGKM